MLVELSSLPIPGTLLYPDSVLAPPLVDYELGGVALRNATQGLRYQVWRLYRKGTSFMAAADFITEFVLLAGVPNVTALCLSFDQNMNPFVGYIANGSAFIWWFDPTVSAQITTHVGDDITSVASTLDDKRPAQTSNSDVHFSYIRNGNLCVRTQRERYLTEHVLAEAPEGRIRRFGMSNKFRLQWDIG